MKKEKQVILTPLPVKEFTLVYQGIDVFLLYKDCNDATFAQMLSYNQRTDRMTIGKSGPMKYDNFNKVNVLNTKEFNLMVLYELGSFELYTYHG